jgi:hypothetical protein
LGAGDAIGPGEGKRILQALDLRRWAWAALVCPLVAAAAEPAAVLTLLEGPATMVRGASRYALAEGVRLQYGDIVEVGERGLAEMEFADGSALSMGPMTRALTLSLPHGAKLAHGTFYVTQGVLKFARVKRDSRLRILSPRLALQPIEGAAVLLLGDEDAAVFVESGGARLSGAGRSLELKAGDFYSGKSVQKGVVGPRPSPAFISALPRQFLDPLPSRMARVGQRAVQPRSLQPVSYADVETWLKAPLSIRRSMPARFKSRAADPAFRAAVQANLRFHPEWDPILFPEKYEQQGPGAAAAVPPGGRR